MPLSRYFKFTIVQCLIFILGTTNLLAQTKHEISGYVKDFSNGESLIGATVRILGTQKAVQTNTYGYFSISTTNVNDSIVVSYVGYQSAYLAAIFSSNKKQEIQEL